MPRPGHRLDLLVVPQPPERVANQASIRAAALAIKSKFKEEYRAVRIDDRSRPWLYANQQGGFRVSCPQSGMSVVVAFSRAWAAYRDGKGDRRMDCDCGSEHPLESLIYAPTAAFGRSALVVSDVSSARLLEPITEQLERELGAFTVVARRVG